MYVGRKHTATIQAEVELPFACAFCRYQGTARVVGVGEGVGNSPYFLDDSGAASRARAQAVEKAHANAELTLKLARCPGCGARDEAAIRWEHLKALLGAAGTVVGMLLLGLFLDATHRGQAGLVICVPIGLVTAVFVYLSQKWKWETVEGRVRFVSRA